MTVFNILPDFSSTHSVVLYCAALGVHVVVFLAVFAVLRASVFKPVLRILQLRRENIDLTEQKTREFSEKAKVMKEEYRWRMDGAGQLAEEKKEVTELIGRRRAEMLLMDVRRETNRDLESVVKSAENAYTAVAPTVQKDILDYAKEISGKILGD